MRLRVLALVYLLLSTPAWTQTSPGLQYGDVPTAAQWNSYFTAKQDLLGFTPLNGLALGGYVFCNFLPTCTASPSIPTSSLLGVTDASSAPTGHLGEVLSSTVLVGDMVPLTTGAPTNVTSILLTPGDWDCRGDVGFEPEVTTTISLMAGGTSGTSSVLPPAGARGVFVGAATWTTGVGASFVVGSHRINVSSPMTTYLVALASFSAGTMSVYGIIECRRMR